MLYLPAPQSPDSQKLAWNKGKLVGQKPPLKPKEIWAIRARLQLRHAYRDLALFNLAIDSKLRGCDLVKLRLIDVMHGKQIMKRAMILQQKTQLSVQFEITEQTREALSKWIEHSHIADSVYLFPSRIYASKHMSTRQYARLVKEWIESIDLDPYLYGTHSLRRSKATLIYQRTKNIRAVQLLLGHSNIESTVRYLGIDVDDALELSEQTDI